MGRSSFCGQHVAGQGPRHTERHGTSRNVRLWWLLERAFETDAFPEAPATCFRQGPLPILLSLHDPDA
jgi:hypothetical protein